MHSILVTDRTDDIVEWGVYTKEGWIITQDLKTSFSQRATTNYSDYVGQT